MKQIQIYFEDAEHKLVHDLKKRLGLNWHDFVMYAVSQLNKQINTLTVSEDKPKDLNTKTD